MVHGVLRISGVASMFGVLACSLLVETSEIAEGCGDGMKFCEDKCVSITVPFYGCTLDGCEPCDNADHIENVCMNGTCVFVACQFGWGCTDCTTPVLTDSKNCGRCGNLCIGGRTCSNGVCVDAFDAGSGAGGEGGTGS